MNADESTHGQAPKSHFHIIRNLRANNQTNEDNFFSTSGHKQVLTAISCLYQENLPLGIKRKLLGKLPSVNLPTPPMA